MQYQLPRLVHVEPAKRGRGADYKYKVGGEGEFLWTSIMKQSEEEREAIAEAERKAKKRRLMAMGLAGEDPEFISSITCCRYVICDIDINV